jgi:hypothetical protein
LGRPIAKWGDCRGTLETDCNGLAKTTKFPDGMDFSWDQLTGGCRLFLVVSHCDFRRENKEQAISSPKYKDLIARGLNQFKPEHPWFGTTNQSHIQSPALER